MSATLFRDSVDPVVTDGRDIDPQIAKLQGEASGQVSGLINRHLQNNAQQKSAQPGEQVPAPLESDPTYYDRPVLQAPVWSWEIPLYYYTGGAAGACLVLGAAAQLDHSGKLNRMIRRCHWAGIIGSSISAALLIGDLGKPSRFLNMLRVFRPTSPMNMGVWILSGAVPTAITAGLFLRRRGFWRFVGESSGFASGMFGMGLATYTGVLVGNSAVPIWQASRRILPFLFGASAMASAGSLFDLLSDDPRERRITYTFGTVGRVAELAAALAMEKQVARVPVVAKPLRSGASGFLWKTATIITAASLIISLLPKTTRRKRVIAGVLGTAGSLALRYAVHQAGVASTQDPRATFHSQRESNRQKEKAPMYGQETIVRYLQDAEAAERTFEDTLAALSKEGDQPEVQNALARMSQIAKTQHERLEARIEALGASRSGLKSGLAHALAFAPKVAQLGETAGQKSTQNLMIVIAAAAAESAMYEALAAAAAAAGDSVTEQLARQLQNEEGQDYLQAALLVRQSAVEAFEQAMNGQTETPAPAANS